jgi:hypothetical protein
MAIISSMRVKPCWLPKSVRFFRQNSIMALPPEDRICTALGWVIRQPRRSGAAVPMPDFAERDFSGCSPDYDNCDRRQ